MGAARGGGGSIGGGWVSRGCYLFSVSIGSCLAGSWTFTLLLIFIIIVRQCMIAILVLCSAAHKATQIDSSSVGCSTAYFLVQEMCKLPTVIARSKRNVAVACRRTM